MDKQTIDAVKAAFQEHNFKSDDLSGHTIAFQTAMDSIGQKSIVNYVTRFQGRPRFHHRIVLPDWAQKVADEVAPENGPQGVDFGGGATSLPKGVPPGVLPASQEEFEAFLKGWLMGRKST